MITEQQWKEIDFLNIFNFISHIELNQDELDQDKKFKFLKEIYNNLDSYLQECKDLLNRYIIINNNTKMIARLKNKINIIEKYLLSKKLNIMLIEKSSSTKLLKI